MPSLSYLPWCVTKREGDRYSFKYKIQLMISKKFLLTKSQATQRDNMTWTYYLRIWCIWIWWIPKGTDDILPSKRQTETQTEMNHNYFGEGHVSFRKYIRKVIVIDKDKQFSKIPDQLLSSLSISNNNSYAHWIFRLNPKDISHIFKPTFSMDEFYGTMKLFSP